MTHGPARSTSRGPPISMPGAMTTGAMIGATVRPPAPPPTPGGGCDTGPVSGMPALRVLGDEARVFPEAHRAAERLHTAQLAQLVDDGGRVREIGVELLRRDVGEAADVPRVFDDRALEAETDAEERDLLLAREAHALD